jgi:hypothetical protein
MPEPGSYGLSEPNPSRPREERIDIPSRFYTASWGSPTKKQKFKVSKKKNYIGCEAKFISNLTINQITVEKGTKAIIKSQYLKGVIVEIETKQIPVPFNKVKIKQLHIDTSKCFDHNAPRTLLREGEHTLATFERDETHQVRNLRRRGAVLEDTETGQYWMLTIENWTQVTKPMFNFPYEWGSTMFLSSILREEQRRETPQPIVSAEGFRYTNPYTIAEMVPSPGIYTGDGLMSQIVSAVEQQAGGLNENDQEGNERLEIERERERQREHNWIIEDLNEETPW